MELTGQARTAATPVVFGPADAWCFGWFHPACTPKRGGGVVLCRPIGYEANCSYEVYTQLAESLARAGFDVLRFDYHGTGDSAGSDADAGRVRAWIDSTTLAIQELKRLAGISSISLFGVRLGATLAAHAATQDGDIESLVMWAPCVTGRTFARELRAASAANSTERSNSASGDIEAFGYLYTAETLQDLGALDCQRLDRPPARRVMIIGRDDMPAGEGPLPARYGEMGVNTAFAALPGYAGMMRDPHEGGIERDTLERIVDWFSAQPMPAAYVPQDAFITQLPSTVSAVIGTVRETPLKFGPTQSLFGIWAEPAEGPTANARSEMAILILNLGGHCHTGPGRVYVNMARSWAASGYRSLRLDVSGIGDSRSPESFSQGSLSSLYSKDHTPDVRAAIDCLATRGCRNFIVMGICSGSYVAFQTAQVDPRVTGQILLNSLRLESNTDQGPSSIQGAVAKPYTTKSTHFYRRALLTPAVYARLLRGQIDVKNIATYFGMLILAKMRRIAQRILRAAPNEENMLIKMKQLTSRGTDTLVIVAAQDPARDFIEFHLGKDAKNMQGIPNFQMIVMEHADHTLSDSRSQEFAIKIIKNHLDTKILMRS